MTDQEKMHVIRVWLVVFMVGLVLSGVTAFPLETEVRWMVRILESGWLRPLAMATDLLPWVERVSGGLNATNASYPFLAYGTDWLAFAHLVLAVAFVGPYREPVRNKWVVDFGLIACAGVIPLALIAGQARGIPVGWRVIDCCFGVFGVLPLLRCRKLIAEMERQV